MAAITDTAGGVLTDEHGRDILDEAEDVRPGSADYADALMALLPSGRVWPREPSSTLVRTVNVLALTFWRIEARARALLTEAPPGRALVELLPEWEATLSLPTACIGSLPTLALRQAAVRGVLAARGGQSVPYYQAVAAQSGQAITVEEFAPSRFGRPFGQRFGGEDWAHAWRVTTPKTVVSPFLFGANRFGEAFRTYGNATLRCTLGRLKPAHTTLQIAYED